MGHRQTQHHGRSLRDDRSLRGRGAAGGEELDDVMDASGGLDEARRIQELVDAARGQWTAAGRGGGGGGRASGHDSGRRGRSGR